MPPWPNTDKVVLGYLPTYQHLAAQIGPAGRVCEVGVYRGASLELWQQLFPEGCIVGVDSDGNARWPAGTIRVLADQTDPQLPDQLVAHATSFDLIVEDASHDGEKTRRTWELLWPLVRSGGWYVIEDWMVGFPSSAEHGWPYDPSMLEMAEGLLESFDGRGGDVDEIVYRYGQIIVRKKP